ncbi:hsp90-like protein [Metarhizium guizhouense ARSEF 977]|uniref:Hsp90-like protein n=1 Tax=Metarhizium guizhouense (strain ARSEF 977) TaxID=1276136 RepID=A0A0B4G3D8_METGA|nr:hsp90-like protein [Metarhizium guizhouense ARSEF 977]
MDHFETKRSSIANRLGEHMIRGVGEFVDESTTLSRKNARKKFGLRSKEVNVKSELASCKDKPPELLPSGQISPAIALSVESTPTQLSQWQRPLVLSADWSEKDNPFGNEKLPVSMASVNSNASATSTDRRKGQSYTSQVWSIFDKASTIVRESMDVDGVVFVEARLSVFGVHGDINRPWGLRVSGSSSSSGDDVSIPAVPTSHDADEEGYAVQSSRSVLASDGPQGPADPAPFNLWEKLLRKLLRRYPRGNIFNFDEFGAEQSSDWSSEEATSANHISAHSGEENRRKLCSNRFRMGQSEQDMLMKMLPGARCIAFAPVWDPQDQRWFAGSFAYTKSRNRVFTARGDLSYLIAFGAVAMTEVCRLRATLADNSKMDMLSSLSHELRSPLHGMVLGLEMLQDTSLDRFQKDIVHTVESCTRTLLDTVNHLLDWTKINNLSTKRPARKVGVDISGRSTEKPLDHDSLTTNTAELNLASGSSAILLDALTEEVVESVFAGYTYQQLTVARSVKSTPNGDNRDHLRRFDGIHATTDDYEFTHPQHVILSGSKDILVNLCIDPAATWSFNTQPGAIRRIIMNLLGNSLKYTATGSITVRVSQSSAHSHRLNNVRTHGHVRTVRIVVSDTGRGISENYLKNHLFVPFSQEDRLSPGVGLGLSLVKRIASALGGYVQVQSRVGQGTTITVSLPLEKSAHSRELTLTEVKGSGKQSNEEFETCVGKLSGLKLRLAGFDTATELTTNAARTAHGQVDFRSNLASTCRNWLGMRVLESEEDKMTTADLILCNEDHLDDLSETTTGTFTTPMVVICRNSLVTRDLEMEWMKNIANGKLCGLQLVDFISQPAGPRKLAKVLASSLQRWQSSSSAKIYAQLTPPEELDQARLPLSDLRIESGVTGLRCGGGETDESHMKSSSLPMPPQAEQKMATPTEYPNRSRFLLVDDNPINIKILSHYLDKMSLLHDTARNGKEAVEVFKEQPKAYKGIFMDLTMPVMNGFEATRLIRQRERESRVPACYIIAMTGLASVEAQKAAIASGIDLFLTKPVKMADLKQVLMSKGLL